jgi:hypothetical protein
MGKAAAIELEFWKVEALFACATTDGCECIGVAAKETALSESIFGFWSP